MTKSLSLKSGDIGGLNLNKKNTILSMLLVLAFLMFTGLSLGQGGNETGGAPVAPANASQSNETGAPGQGALNLNYIWSFSNIEAGPVTMLINQEGSDLFGQAKYEPDSGTAWNAEVIGSLAGDKVELTMTAQKGTELFTTKMTGTYASDTITGNWTQISGGKKVGSGAFMAMWVSPDTASYTPVVIKDTVAATPQMENSNAASIPNSIVITESSLQPNAMTIAAGTTVTWINSGSNDQQVAASNGEFDSGKIAPNGQYQYTFSKAGTYDYYSKTNSGITGEIIVTDNSKSRFVDVRQYKDKIGPGGDLSGIPPGMGGAGLN